MRSAVRSRPSRPPTSTSRVAGGTRCMPWSGPCSPSPASAGAADPAVRGVQADAGADRPAYGVRAGSAVGRFGRGVGPLVDLLFACALRSCAHEASSRAVLSTGAPRPVPSRFCRPLTAYRPPSERRSVANIKSQLKRIKTNAVATERNKAVRSELKTWIRKFRAAADAGQVEEAKAALKTASTKLDKAVSKGVIHANQAANKKSAMAKKAASL